MQTLSSLTKSIIQGERKKAAEFTDKALKQKIQPEKILKDGLVAGMSVVGKNFKENKIFIPEVLLAAKSMQDALNILKPALVKKGVKPVATAVIGTVKGDIHDIGKNLVGMMLQGSGFTVVDLGYDVPPEKFLDTVKKEKADCVCLSALLTTTMTEMESVISLFARKGMRKDVRILVGGAPLTEKFAKKIHADGYAQDAASAVEVARKLLRLN